MTRNLPYRKYRPMVQVHKNSRIWSENTFTLCLCFFYAIIHSMQHWTPPMSGSFFCSVFQVELCDQRHPGGRCKASSPHVVMEAHSASSTDGEMLQRALQDKNHDQETHWRAAEGSTGRKTCLQVSYFTFLFFQTAIFLSLKEKVSKQHFSQLSMCQDSEGI